MKSLSSEMAIRTLQERRRSAELTYLGHRGSDPSTEIVTPSPTPNITNR